MLCAIDYFQDYIIEFCVSSWLKCVCFNTILSCVLFWTLEDSFKKSCNLDDWKERKFSLNKEGDLVYVNRLGFDSTLEVSGCMITFVEVGILDAEDRPDVVLALELLVAKSSKRTKCM